MTSYVLHTNKIPDGTVTVTSEATGYEKENAHDWLLYDFWKAAAAGTVRYSIDFGSAVTIDSWGVAAHTLADNSGTIKPQYSATGAYGGEEVDFDTVQTPSDSAVIFRKQAAVSARYWSFLITSTTVASLFGQLLFGEALALPYAMRVQFISPKNARNKKISNNVSKTGVFLGRSIYDNGSRFNIMQDSAAESWVDANWDAFADAIEAHPFLFLWDDTGRPGEAAFVWTDGDVQPPKYTNYAPDPLMQFMIPVRGVID
jgi:hypothetical protein